MGLSGNKRIKTPSFVIISNVTHSESYFLCLLHIFLVYSKFYSRRLSDLFVTCLLYISPKNASTKRATHVHHRDLEQCLAHSRHCKYRITKHAGEKSDYGLDSSWCKVQGGTLHLWSTDCALRTVDSVFFECRDDTTLAHSATTLAY